MRLTLVFLMKEWADLRGDKRVWLVYLILPIVGFGVTAAMVIMAPDMLRLAREQHDPGMQSLLRVVALMPELHGRPEAEAVSQYLFRLTSAMFLLMPVAMSSTVAAFSVVGEKQQRTLEPILATPISDKQFMLGKLIACIAPTVAATWLAALLAWLTVAIVTGLRLGSPVLPDRFVLLTVLVLSPLIAATVTLVTMRMSAKATDPQATVQTAALAVVPGFLLLVGVFGRLLSMYFLALVGACVVIALLAAALYRMNVLFFEREEILTRWR